MKQCSGFVHGFIEKMYHKPAAAGRSLFRKENSVRLTLIRGGDPSLKTDFINNGLPQGSPTSKAMGEAMLVAAFSGWVRPISRANRGCGIGTFWNLRCLSGACFPVIIVSCFF